jgi:membrane protein YqaA with SNARE-associated domain
MSHDRSEVQSSLSNYLMGYLLEDILYVRKRKTDSTKQVTELLLILLLQDYSIHCIR